MTGLKPSTVNPKTRLCMAAKQPKHPSDHRPRTKSDHWKTTWHHTHFGHYLAGLNHGCYHEGMSGFRRQKAWRQRALGIFTGRIFSTCILSVSIPMGATGQRTGQAIMTLALAFFFIHIFSRRLWNALRRCSVDGAGMQVQDIISWLSHLYYYTCGSLCMAHKKCSCRF